VSAPLLISIENSPHFTVAHMFDFGATAISGDDYLSIWAN
jgi:hypothetical protein